jgi:EAL domain-containing protein (putative c-di-GMP-specific phosphodiesterase class I)/GGDEF domain-containing protein
MKPSPSPRPPETVRPETPTPIFGARSPRLTPAALVQTIDALTLAGRRCVLLLVSLHRSDRLAALAQSRASREVIGEVMRRVEGMLRSSDRYALASHEELWVLLVDPPGESLAELAGRTLRANLSRPIHVSLGDTATPVRLQPAVGGAWQPVGGGTDAMTLIGAATDACRESEELESRVRIVTAQSSTEVNQRRQLEHELREALFANELDVHFQPQVSLETGRCTGAEALVRWTRRDGTRVNPGLIAAICEARGLMTQMTLFVMNTTLRHLMAWNSQGIDARVSVNLSAVTLADPAFPSLVGHALDTWSIAASRLTLELTETAVVRHEQSAMQFMKEIRERGCGLALDDFGTGYSSFNYLRQFPLTELKIDQSFVRNLATDASDRRIVLALVDLAHTFGMHALAEGVEDAPSAQALRELGCDLAQGYHYARPMPQAEFIDWWRTFNRAPARESVATA